MPLQLQVDSVDVTPYPTEHVRSLIVGKASRVPAALWLRPLIPPQPGTSVSLVFSRAGHVTLTRALPVM